MYTHICIESGKHEADCNPKIKKGDYCTLNYTQPHKYIPNGIAYVFKEDKYVCYDSQSFLPLPPPIVKTQYVSVSEEVVKELPEPVLN